MCFVAEERTKERTKTTEKKGGWVHIHSRCTVHLSFFSIFSCTVHLCDHFCTTGARCARLVHPTRGPLVPSVHCSAQDLPNLVECLKNSASLPHSKAAMAHCSSEQLPIEAIFRHSNLPSQQLTPLTATHGLKDGPHSTCFLVYECQRSLGSLIRDLVLDLIHPHTVRDSNSIFKTALAKGSTTTR